MIALNKEENRRYGNGEKLLKTFPTLPKVSAVKDMDAEMGAKPGQSSLACLLLIRRGNGPGIAWS